MNQDLLIKIIDSDISRASKEKILEYWLLPPKEDTLKAPIQKVRDEVKVGAIKRPNKAELELRANPKMKEEQEAMEETLKGVVGEDI